MMSLPSATSQDPPPRADAGPRRRRRGLAILVSLCVFVVLVLVVETGARLLGPRLGMNVSEISRVRSYVHATEAGFMEPRPYYGFAMRASAAGNRWGFQGRDWNVERTEGVLRIACLGGSTTHSGNELGHRGSYPHLLEEYLGATSDAEVEVMNCGISMWTSNETVAAWFVLLKDFRPDLVLFHHAANDVEPRNRDGFRPDYAHYRKSWDPPSYGPIERHLVKWSDLYAWYLIENEPPSLRTITTQDLVGQQVFARTGAFEPSTAKPFVRNILSIASDVRSWGGEMMLVTMPTDPAWEEKGRTNVEAYLAGIDDHNRIMRELATEHGFLLADVAQRFAEHPKVASKYFSDIVHLSPEGNLAKAKKAGEVLLESWDPLATGVRANAGPGDAGPGGR